MRSIGVVLRLFQFMILFLAGCTLKLPPVERTFRLAWENLPRTVDPRYSVDADSQYLGILFIVL